MFRKSLFIITFLLCVYGVNTSAQVPCPAAFVCISQEAANRAAENARELPAVKDKVTALEQALKDKDSIIAANKDAAGKNEADLKAALVKTQTDLATATGQIISLHAQTVRDAALIDILLKNTRSKCLPFSVCIGH